MRGWVTRRVWLEAGGGLAGVEVLRGAHVSLNVDARYTTSEFDGLKVRRINMQITLLGRQWAPGCVKSSLYRYFFHRRSPLRAVAPPGTPVPRLVRDLS
jgi:hypothetical protein